MMRVDADTEGTDRMDELADFNRQVIDEFRANDGVVGGMFEGTPLLLLTVTGRSSGRRLTSPLAYGLDGDVPFVVASKAGAPTHPQWYLNLSADPHVHVEIGADAYDAVAAEATGDERDRLYELMVERSHVFAEYAEKAGDRVIPVVRLVRT